MRIFDSAFRVLVQPSQEEAELNEAVYASLPIELEIRLDLGWETGLGAGFEHG